MTTKVVNPTTKSNLTKEIIPYVSIGAESYKITYCLFSQFNAYELLEIYSSWNWAISESEGKDNKNDVQEMVACLVKSIVDITGSINRWEIGIHWSLEQGLETIYHKGLKGAMLIDSLMIDYIDIDNRYDDSMKCAILTKQMFLNYHLLNEKDFIIDYDKIKEK